MRPLTPGLELDDWLAPYREVERRPLADRPWVLTNMVSGLDGCAAVRGRVGALSDPVDRSLFRMLRSLADVVLVGAETVRAEDYGRVRLSEETQQARRAAGRRPLPRLAVVSRSLELDVESRLFSSSVSSSVSSSAPGPRPILLTCEASDVGRRARLAAVADVMIAGESSVDLARALRGLRQQEDEIVLCEGGPALLGQMAEARLIDELCLTLSPVMGGDALPVAISSATSDLTRFRLAQVLNAEDTLFLRYESLATRAEAPRERGR
ncbi:MAG: pyrimidine reductase family protein [bacterium]